MRITLAVAAIAMTMLAFAMHRAPAAKAGIEDTAVYYLQYPAEPVPVGTPTVIRVYIFWGFSGPSGSLSFQVPSIPGFKPYALTAPVGWNCPSGVLADGTVTGSECTSPGPLVGFVTYTFTLNGIVTGPGKNIELSGISWVDNANGATRTMPPLSIALASNAGAYPTPQQSSALAGTPVTVTFHVPAGSTCESDGDLSPDLDIECSAMDLYNPSGLTVVSPPAAVAGDNDTATPSTVTTTVIAGPGTATIALRLKPTGPAGAPGTVTAQAVEQLQEGSVVTYMSYPAEITGQVAELRHVTDDALRVITTGETLGGQDVQNNVRGSRHVVCTVLADTGTVANPTPVAVQIPLTLPNTQISVVPGGGYTGAESVTQPQSPTFTDVQVFTGNGRPVGDIVNGVPGNGGLAGATCFSWVSTGAGDQEISINYVSNGVTVHADWDTNANGNGLPVRQNRALIKEWNVLEDSQVQLLGGATGAAVGDSTTAPVLTTTVSLVQNPSSQLYQTGNGQDISVTDVFMGGHVTRANSNTRTFLAGVIWTVNWSGCGLLYDSFVSTNIDATSTTLLVQSPAFSAGDVIKVESEYMLVTHVDNSTLTVVRGTSATGAAGGSTPAAHNGGVAVLIVQGTTMLVNTSGAVWHSPAPNFSPGLTPANNCTPGSTANIVFTGREPGPLGSGQGLTVTEQVRLDFATTVSQKKVMLAWAGQRVIIEADWRIPPGDTGGTWLGSYFDIKADPLGTCPFRWGQMIRYTKGSGPGNFVAGLGVYLDGADEATVRLGASELAPTAQIPTDQIYVNVDASQAGDAPERPQDACISRAIFESEDPGQVDLEVFAYDDRVAVGVESHMTVQGLPPGGGVLNVTKRAFVIYYMKFENVAVSFVDDVSKGVNHNSPVLTDFTPGNPWDASKDVSSVNWNVSKDLLVRGRVRGWFVNENPSGRPVNTDDPLNILPANRWVMPDDWALLAGGPADKADNSTATGTAEEFRPYYDIMIDPAQTRFMLGLPGGVVYRVTAVADWPVTGGSVVNTASRFAIANSPSSSGLKAGVIVIVGVGTVTSTTPPVSVMNTRKVTSADSITNAAGDIVGFSITLDTPLAAVPAAGAAVAVLSPATFEGPYSLIDVCSAAPAYNDCIGGSNPPSFSPGAALSNFYLVRDTAWRDGDVDRWDAPMPPAMLSVKMRGTGFIKEVMKYDVYYVGTQNGGYWGTGGDQFFPNPFYASNIPDSPYLPAVVSGGGYLWDSWGTDGSGPGGMGPYSFWDAVRIGTNSQGIGDPTLNTDDAIEIADIRAAYGD
ncbi:MAG: hypothetical protein IT302_00445, partial [Dehalococcoidia bacterium]|nr:hypothetical protein [Dehalococcoidia bacterium]